MKWGALVDMNAIKIYAATLRGLCAVWIVCQRSNCLLPGAWAVGRYDAVEVNCKKASTTKDVERIPRK